MDVGKPVTGWWKVHQEKREHVLEKMRFRPEIASAAEKAISRVAKKVKNLIFQFYLKNFAHLRVTLNHVALKLIPCFLFRWEKRRPK